MFIFKFYFPISFCNLWVHLFPIWDLEFKQFMNKILIFDINNVNLNSEFLRSFDLGNYNSLWTWTKHYNFCIYLDQIKTSAIFISTISEEKPQIFWQNMKLFQKFENDQLGLCKRIVNFRKKREDQSHRQTMTSIFFLNDNWVQFQPTNRSADPAEEYLLRRKRKLPQKNHLYCT